MANYNDLKTAIQQAIRTNGNEEITGALMQQSLLAMINSLGAGYQFIGVATPSTNPGTPDQKVFYITNGAGTYSNFSNIVINYGEVAILIWDSAWHKRTINIASIESNELFFSTINKILGNDNGNVVAFDGQIPFSSSAITFNVNQGDKLFISFNGHEVGSALVIGLGNSSSVTQYLINDSTKESGVVVVTASGNTNQIRFYLEDYHTYARIVVLREDSNRLKNIESLFEPKETVVSIPCIVGQLLNANGTTSSGSTAWGTSDFIKVNKGNKIKLLATQYPSSPYVALQIYNLSKEIIENFISGEDIFDNTMFQYEVENDGYIRICYRVSSGYTASLIKLESLNNRLDALESGQNLKRFAKNINFVGMSIWWYDGKELGAGHVGGEIAKGYQTLLKQQFDFLSDTGANYCYSGCSLGAISLSDLNCIMNYSSNWLTSNNAIWTLDTITNDFKRNIPIGSYSDYTNKTGILTYYGALREFADKVLALSGSNAIVVCSNSLRRNNGGYTSTSQNTQGHTLTDYEYALMNVASRNHWYFIDQFRLCGITDDTIELTTIDGLHLNNFGYTLAVKPWIEQLEIIRKSLME